MKLHIPASYIFSVRFMNSRRQLGFDNIMFVDQKMCLFHKYVKNYKFKLSYLRKLSKVTSNNVANGK